MGRDHTGTFTEKIKRQVYLDKLRVLATVLVIAVHTVSLGSTLVPERSAVWYGFEISNYLFLCCNLLFIMISGALLLPVKGESAGQFYRKRFLKVLVPMVIYYILYVCAKEGFVWLRPDHWGVMLKRILLGAPEEAPHFWLIYVIEAIDGNSWISGVIDRLLLHDGSACIVDFKTDHADSPEQLRERHSNQLNAYARIVSRITGIPPERIACIIVSTHLKETIRI